MLAFPLHTVTWWFSLKSKTAARTITLTFTAWVPVEGCSCQMSQIALKIICHCDQETKFNWVLYFISRRCTSPISAALACVCEELGQEHWTDHRTEKVGPKCRGGRHRACGIPPSVLQAPSRNIYCGAGSVPSPGRGHRAFQRVSELVSVRLREKIKVQKNRYSVSHLQKF